VFSRLRKRARKRVRVHIWACANHSFHWFLFVSSFCFMWNYFLVVSLVFRSGVGRSVTKILFYNRFTHHRKKEDHYAEEDKDATRSWELLHSGVWIHKSYNSIYFVITLSFWRLWYRTKITEKNYGRKTFKTCQMVEEDTPTRSQWWSQNLPNLQII